MKEREELFGYYPSVFKSQGNTGDYIKGKTEIRNSHTSEQKNLK